MLTTRRVEPHLRCDAFSFPSDRSDYRLRARGNSLDSRPLSHLRDNEREHIVDAALSLGV
jgi:hypothetical protein